MVLKTVSFKIKEKQKTDFQGKCKNKKESMYSALKGLVDQYIKGETVKTIDSTKIEELQKQLDEKERNYQRLVKERDAQIEELKKETNLFNIEKQENLHLLKRICFFAIEKSQGRNVTPLSESESQFCFRFIHRE